DLALGGGHGLAEARHLGLHRLGREDEAQDGTGFSFEQERRSQRDPLGHAGAGQLERVRQDPSSPKPELISVASASTAASSSSPSAASSSTLPWEAARSKMPRIDLPSMTFPWRPTVTRERKRLAVCTKRAAARACRPSR